MDGRVFAIGVCQKSDVEPRESPIQQLSWILKMETMLKLRIPLPSAHEVDATAVLSSFMLSLRC